MSNDFSAFRRKLVLGGLALGVVGTGLALRPGDRGADHSDYFRNVSAALDRQGLARPTMVVDKSTLLRNTATLTADINGRYDYRVVGKSLPSIPLLELVMKETNTKKVMMFHEPFLRQLAKDLPESDVLIGKPMPVAAAANFYKFYDRNSQFSPSNQLQWLIDSYARLQQYQTLAKGLGTAMRINIELDVGLHRGGVQNNTELVQMLELIESDPLLSFTGFMGYEPHVAKVPGNKIKARDHAMSLYTEKVDVARQLLGNDLDHLTLNAAGSPTYKYYTDNDFVPNELSAGSCLVKPVDFDLPTLAGHLPASYIATPVLKALDKSELAGVGNLGDLMALWNLNRAKTFFTYGGYWKAKPESPKGISLNPVFGRSTNQEMYNASRSVNLGADDWMFFRPTQSEFVFLQFGDLAIYDDGEIVDMWPVFNTQGT